MPITYKESTTAFHLKCWTINESLHELQLMCAQNRISIDFIAKTVVESRQKELMVGRLMLHSMGIDVADLYYDEHRKPYLKSNSHNLSISHTEGIAALLVSEKYEVGVDVEKKSDRVQKIKSKFLSADELAVYDDLPESLKIQWLLLAWCTKEALYKFTSRIYFDFKKHFSIKNIDLNGCDIQAACLIEGEEEVAVSLCWKSLENEYVLVHTIPTPIV